MTHVNGNVPRPGLPSSKEEAFSRQADGLRSCSQRLTGSSDMVQSHGQVLRVKDVEIFREPWNIYILYMESRKDYSNWRHAQISMSQKIYPSAQIR